MIYLKINYANISVNITDEFMQAVVEDKEYELYFYVDATVEEKLENYKCQRII